MDIEKVKEFIKILEESDLKKMTIREKDSELVLEKEDTHFHNTVHIPVAHNAQSSHNLPSIPLDLEEKKQEEGAFVTSPMVGTFYKKPAPDHKDFVQVGDRVEKDTIVCIIEAMKVMNEVKAGVAGTVVEVLVEDIRPVEFGTKLYRVI